MAAAIAARPRNQMPSGSSARVAGIVLAAGSSRRMGRDKLYLELGGQSVLRRACGCALASGLAPVLVVLGPDPARARRELDGLPLTLLENPDHARGMDTSLRCGIRSVPAEADAALVLLADMPFVTPEMVDRVTTAYRSSRPSLVVSRYAGVKAPPTLYDRGLFEEFGAGRCGRHVVADHLDAAILIDFAPEALCDLDVESDYRRALTRFQAGDPGATTAGA